MTEQSVPQSPPSKRIERLLTRRQITISWYDGETMTGIAHYGRYAKRGQDRAEWLVRMLTGRGYTLVERVDGFTALVQHVRDEVQP